MDEVQAAYANGFDAGRESANEETATLRAALAKAETEAVQRWKDANGYDDLLKAHNDAIARASRAETERDDLRVRVEGLQIDVAAITKQCDTAQRVAVFGHLWSEHHGAYPVKCTFCGCRFTDDEGNEVEEKHSAVCPDAENIDSEEKVRRTLDMLAEARAQARTFRAAVGFERDRHSEFRKAIEAELDAMPEAIRVREGGGPENLAASIAVTVSKLRELAAGTGFDLAATLGVEYRRGHEAALAEIRPTHEALERERDEMWGVLARLASTRDPGKSRAVEAAIDYGRALIAKGAV